MYTLTGTDIPSWYSAANSTGASMAVTASKESNPARTETQQEEGSVDTPVEDEEIKTPVKGPPTKGKLHLGVRPCKSSKK